MYIGWASGLVDGGGGYTVLDIAMRFGKGIFYV